MAKRRVLLMVQGTHTNIVVAVLLLLQLLSGSTVSSQVLTDCSGAFVARGNGKDPAGCLDINSTASSTGPIGFAANRKTTFTCCGKSGNPRKDSNGVCYPYSKTHTEAERLCVADGGRLCTRNEIQENVASGQGCGFDHYFTWTADPCGCKTTYDVNGTKCTLPSIDSSIGIYEGDSTQCQSGNSLAPGTFCTIRAQQEGYICQEPGICNNNGRWEHNASCYLADAKYNCSHECSGSWPYGCSHGWNDLALLRCFNGGGCAYFTKTQVANGDVGSGGCVYRDYLAPRETGTLAYVSAANPSPSNPSPASPSPSAKCAHVPPTPIKVPEMVITPQRRNISIPNGFLGHSEDDYLKHFDELIADSHADAALAPLALKQACMGKGQFFDPNAVPIQSNCVKKIVARGVGNGELECRDPMSTDADMTTTCCGKTTGQTNPRYASVTNQCYEKGKTFAEAAQACAADGGRLCTNAEIKSGVSKHQGCQFDSKFTWTSDECDCELQDPIPTVTVSTGKNGNVVTSSEVQTQCGISTICFIPAGIGMKMNSPLNVAALRVQGTVHWDIHTQGALSSIWLCAGYVAIEDGGNFTLDMSSNFQQSAYIFIKDNGAKHSILGTRAFGTIGVNKAAYVDIKGRPFRRTWSLLARSLRKGETSLKLMHDPQLSGWKIGDRIVVGPTGKRSTGQAQAFYVTGFGPFNKVYVDRPAIPLKVVGDGVSIEPAFVATFESIPLPGKAASLRSAEVMDMTRNVVITGDDFRHVPCDPTLGQGDSSMDGCRCSGERSQCTIGLHTIHMFKGVQKIKHARVEKCGQRGILGKYCMHFHLNGDCPACVIEGNAIEFGQQRAIVAHGVHRSLITFNVINDVRGAGIYVEDGNEMYNVLSFNIIICPWGNNDNTKRGCSVPGTPNGQADTALNQVAIWITGGRNHLVGNRAVNSFNGMLYNPLGNGVGAVQNQLCYIGMQPFARFDGNTFHGHGRFGTYGLGALFPKTQPSATVSTNGLTIDPTQCNAYTPEGYDNGILGIFNSHFDYGNTFVGHYSAGDIQYRRHVALENGNNLYWKESKTPADGCSALLKDGYYRSGNIALPDEGAFIIENVVIAGTAGFEANHHCHVGATGILCMPTYILHNTRKLARGSSDNWCYFQNNDPSNFNMANGGIFTLSPPNCRANKQEPGLSDSFFSPGFCSVVDAQYNYLTSFGKNVNNETCVLSSTYGERIQKRYNSGSRDSVLCTVPLRALKIYSKDHNEHWEERNVDPLHVELWYDNNEINDMDNDLPADVHAYIPFHQIGTRSTDGGGGMKHKQGYSLPVVPVLPGTPYTTHKYRLSLGNGNDRKPIPSDWVITFSDPIFGNRWEADAIVLEVVGRTCPHKTSSQHDRRHFAYFHGGAVASMYGHGACSSYGDMPRINCSEIEEPQPEHCPQFCPSGCGGDKAYCDCGLKKCICQPGYISRDNMTGAHLVGVNDPGTCELDLCDAARCSAHGVCSAKYLGGDIPVSQMSCICESGWSGPLCNENLCERPLFSRNCSGHGSCRVVGASTTKCDCEDGYSGENCGVSCHGVCPGDFPFGCAGTGWLHKKYFRCNSGGGCAYANTEDVGWCTYKVNDAIDETFDDSCVTENDCRFSSSWNCTTGSCNIYAPRADGTPCNSQSFGICANGNCVAGSVESVIGGGSASSPQLPILETDAVGVVVLVDDTHTHIVITGPASDEWFGVGFGASSMGAKPYAIIVLAEDVVERKLGNHVAGTLLSSMLTVTSNYILGNRRIVEITRPRVGLTSEHYSFSGSGTTIRCIYAIGFNLFFGFHKKMGTDLLVEVQTKPASFYVTTTAAPLKKIIKGSFSMNTSPVIGVIELKLPHVKKALEKDLAKTLDVPTNCVRIVDIYKCPGDNRCSNRRRALLGDTKFVVLFEVAGSAEQLDTAESWLASPSFMADIEPMIEVSLKANLGKDTSVNVYAPHFSGSDESTTEPPKSKGSKNNMVTYLVVAAIACVVISGCAWQARNLLKSRNKGRLMKRPRSKQPVKFSSQPTVAIAMTKTRFENPDSPSWKIRPPIAMTMNSNPIAALHKASQST